MSDNYHQAVMGGTGRQSHHAGHWRRYLVQRRQRPSDAPPNNRSINMPGTAQERGSALSEIENPNAQPGTNNWYTEDGYGGGSLTARPRQLRRRLLRQLLRLRRSPACFRCRLSAARSATRSIPKCAAGHCYLLNNYNPGYFGDGTNAYTDNNPHNNVFTVPPSNRSHHRR